MKLKTDNTILSKITQKTCTGCGGCKNICPVDAIDLHEDDEGFLFPDIDENICINCGECLRTCPAVNTKNTQNNTNPPIYAVRAADEIREKSSSGGVFSLFAEYILNNNGCVIGAAFDENFRLRHAIAENDEELSALRKSKYLQSDTEWIYRETKEKLEQGRLVLFTGCPCQIAAFYNYLGKDYDQLYTIDLLCHGVPSQRSFDEYLYQLSYGNMPQSVDFRDKRHGWTSNFVDIVFPNGNRYVGRSKSDVYERGFYSNLTLRQSCSDCMFSELPRCADLTMGDFWGIDSVDPSQNDGKGTSMLLVNNAKGLELFRHIKENCIAESVITDLSVLPNRFNRIYPSNPNRQRFYELIKTHTFKKAVEQALDGKHDIGLVGNYRAGNFGGALTYFSLYEVLKDLGYSVLMIERPLSAKVLPVSLDFLYKSNPYPNCDIAPLCNTRQEMRKFNKDCDEFVVGSDQLFQFGLFKELDSFVTLDWVSDNKPKIAYAASFGRDYIWGDNDSLSEMAYFMQKFDAFSVREESGVAIARDIFGVQADWVLDPVFLCNKSHFEELTENIHKERNIPYVAAYILDPAREKDDMIRAIADALKMDTEVFSEMNYSTNPEYVAALRLVNVVDYKVDERVECIMHCDFFVTDSFHGTCLSIIFKKPFITILNARRGGERFRSLLTHLGLDDRLVENIDQCDWQCLIEEPVNFEKAYKILEKDISNSYHWLKNALSVKYQKPFTDYDMICRKIEEQEKEISCLNQKITQLMKNLGQEIATVDDIYDYLDLLIKEKAQLVIIVAVKDTPGFSLNENISGKLHKLGFRKDLTHKHWHSYVGILNGGRVLYERLSRKEESITYHGNIKNKKIYVKSASLHQGNVASIVIDNREYAINKRGLNIVVLNKKDGKIIDSVCFDTHSRDLNCYRSV